MVFQFQYLSAIGESVQHVIPMSPKDNGKMLFFSNSLPHIVYPFYGGDKERISIAGNLKYYTGD